MKYILLNYLEIFSIVIYIAIAMYFLSYQVINTIIYKPLINYIIPKLEIKRKLIIIWSFGIIFLHLFTIFLLFILFDYLIEIFIKFYIDITLNFNFNTVVWSYFAIPTVIFIFCIIHYVIYKIGNIIIKENK